MFYFQVIWDEIDNNIKDVMRPFKHLEVKCTSGW
jgi:hypothetical protein